MTNDERPEALVLSNGDHLCRVEYQPGDVVALFTPLRVGAGYREELIGRIKECFPAISDVVVFDQDVKCAFLAPRPSRLPTTPNKGRSTNDE